MKSLNKIQLLHLWNTFMGVLTLCLLIGAAVNIRHFINNGSVSAGYGNFTTFAYPATFVYMFIPTASAFLYSIILAFDFSPNYKAWLPSKTMRGTILFFTAAVFLAALLPVVPGADVMTDDSALSCAWTNYMEWKTIYNAPDIYPWVTRMDTACTIFKAADAFAWILFLGWLAQFVLYIRAAHYAKAFVSK